MKLVDYILTTVMLLFSTKLSKNMKIEEKHSINIGERRKCDLFKEIHKDEHTCLKKMKSVMFIKIFKKRGIKLPKPM